MEIYNESTIEINQDTQDSQVASLNESNDAIKSLKSQKSNMESTISNTPDKININDKQATRDIESGFFSNLMKMNQNSLQMLIKKIITRINLLERKVDDQFLELNESKINRLDRELQCSNNDFEPICEYDEDLLSDDESKTNAKNQSNQNNHNNIDNLNEFKQGMNMVTELNDNVLKLYCHIADIDSKIKNLTENKLDKAVFDQQSSLRDQQLESMRESFDSSLNNLKNYINNEITSLSSIINIKPKNKEFEEPMLSKKPLHCASCNREIIHAKLNQPEHIAWNTITSSTYTPRKTAYGSVYGSVHSNVDCEINKHDLKRDSSRNTKREDVRGNFNSNEMKGRKDFKSLTGDNWNKKIIKERDNSNGKYSEINYENKLMKDKILRNEITRSKSSMQLLPKQTKENNEYEENYTEKIYQNKFTHKFNDKINNKDFRKC